MFFILSKTVYFLFMPLGLITVTLLLAWRLKDKKWKKRCIYVALFLGIVFTNPFLGNISMRLWEQPPVPINELETYDLAIVLTGVAKSRMEPRDRVYFNKGADRVVHAFQLFKEGKVKKILISGGSGALIKPEYSEANTLKKAFLMLGVPDSLLITEEESQNTWQSAQNVKKYFSDEIKGKNLLITSAFHMKRAMGCFQKSDIRIDSFPVDYYSDPIIFTPESLIPTAFAMTHWQKVLHEMLGITAYKIMGYMP